MSKSKDSKPTIVDRMIKQQANNKTNRQYTRQVNTPKRR